jgi:thermitase
MVANNGAGSAGVAWGAKIMPVRISDRRHAYMEHGRAGHQLGCRQGRQGGQRQLTRVGQLRPSSRPPTTCAARAAWCVSAAGNNSGLQSYPARRFHAERRCHGQQRRRRPASRATATMSISPPRGPASTRRPTAAATPTCRALRFPAPSLLPRRADDVGQQQAQPGGHRQDHQVDRVDLGTAGFDQYFGFGRIDAAKAVAATYAKSHHDHTTRPRPRTPRRRPSASPRRLAAACRGRSGRCQLFRQRRRHPRRALRQRHQAVATDDTSPFAFSWDTSTYMRRFLQPGPPRPTTLPATSALLPRSRSRSATTPPRP